MKEATNFRNDLSHGLLGDRGMGLNAVYVWWICLHLCFGSVPTSRTDDVETGDAMEPPSTSEPTTAVTSNPTPAPSGILEHQRGDQT